MTTKLTWYFLKNRSKKELVKILVEKGHEQAEISEFSKAKLLRKTYSLYGYKAEDANA